MSNLRNRILAGLVLLMTFGCSLQAGGDDLKMTLKDCIVKAVQNNLGVAVEVINPQLAQKQVALASEMYLPQLSFGYGMQSTQSPSFSWIDAGEESTSEYADYQATFAQLIPTGGQFNINLYSYSSETNQNYQTIDPRYGSQLTFQFNQPLLKNFGPRIAGRDIILAKNNREISENQFKENLMQTVYTVEEAYWNLTYSINNLKALQRSIELAEDLLFKNKREVEVGTLALIEIKSAEAEVAMRKADILQAELLVQNNEDTLLTLLNLKELGLEQRIIPIDELVFEITDPDLDLAVQTAIENRPDLKRLRASIKNYDLDLTYSRNQLLPELTLRASHWSPGISGNQILYQGNNPLTNIIIGTIPGDSIDALKQAFDFLYRNWSVDLTLSIPVNTLFGRAQLARAKLGLDQAKLRLEYQEQQDFLEIRNAVRALETNYRRVVAYRAARELALETLTAEEKKLQVGFSTNYQVLQYQRDLANARSRELRAIIDYNLSLAALERATGTILQKNNIQTAALYDD